VDAPVLTFYFLFRFFVVTTDVVDPDVASGGLKKVLRLRDVFPVGCLVPSLKWCVSRTLFIIDMEQFAVGLS
jgi:hypothetical protein